MHTLADVLKLKKQHLQRLANQNGAAGEQSIIADASGYYPRPKGAQAKNLLAALKERGIEIKSASFDAIALPTGCDVDFSDMESIREWIDSMIFIEIKTANQARVKDDFSGFFFAFTEGEILAAEALGSRHKVLLVNKVTASTYLTSIPELLARSRSMNWQLSVQL